MTGGGLQGKDKNSATAIPIHPAPRNRRLAQELFRNEPTWRCRQNPSIGALRIQEPVILREPQIKGQPMARQAMDKGLAKDNEKIKFQETSGFPDFFSSLGLLLPLGL